MKGFNKISEIGGSKKFIQWLETYNNVEKHDIQKYKLQNDYDIHLLIVEFDDGKYNYGVLYCIDDEPIFVSFGQTFESYDGEYRSYFMSYSDLQKEYDAVMNLFHNLEKIIQSMIRKNILILTTMNLSKGMTELSFYNIMILAVVVNLNVKNIVNNLYESHIDPMFVKLINHIYDYDSSIIINPYIKINNQIGSKITPIENISDFNHYGFSEIEINMRVSDLVTNNHATMFPIFIDWIFIKPITRNFFNNQLLKRNMSDTINISNLVLNKDTKKLGAAFGKDIETYVGTLFLNQYVGHTISDIFTFYKKCPIEPCHIFELMYGLYILHCNNIIHSDICLTNITFTESQKKINGVNVYILSEYGEDDTYVFDVNPINCFIIDFSKSIVNTKFFEDSIKSQIYCQKQNNRIISLIEQFVTIDPLPDIDTIFPVLCLIDYIDLSTCLQVIFKDTDIIPLLTQIYDLSTKLFTKYITSPVENIELALFKQLFDSYLFNKDDINSSINHIQYIFK